MKPAAVEENVVESEPSGTSQESAAIEREPGTSQVIVQAVVDEVETACKTSAGGHLSEVRSLSMSKNKAYL